jgi:hypothetical protein
VAKLRVQILEIAKVASQEEVLAAVAKGYDRIKTAVLGGPAGEAIVYNPPLLAVENLAWLPAQVSKAAI